MAQLASLLRLAAVGPWLNDIGSIPIVQLLQGARSPFGPEFGDQEFGEDDLIAPASDYFIPVGRRSPIRRCVNPNCTAPTGGATNPYCQDCYIKSLDPKGGVAPILAPIRVPKDE